MSLAQIKIAYKQVIDSSSKGSFETDVFNDSYNEFLMQSQAYNPENKFKTLRDLIQNNPKANSLHYKVGFAIGLYVIELRNLIPGLDDSLGKSLVPFNSHRFEILESEIGKKSAHRVAITYESDVLTLFGIVGDYLILSPEQESKEFAETFMLSMRPNLAIVQWQAQHEHESFPTAANSI